MTAPLTYFLFGSVYDLMLPCLFYFALFALFAYLLLRAVARGTARPEGLTTIDLEHRSEPADESRDGPAGP